MGQKGSARNILNLLHFPPLKAAKASAFIITEKKKNNLLNSLRLHSLCEKKLWFECA